MKILLVKAVALWCVVLLLAILNGALRERALIPAFGSVTGLIASGVTLSACIFLVALAGAGCHACRALLAAKLRDLV